MIIIIAIIAWWLIGVAGFVFWWTRENDFTTSDIPAMAIIGILGMIAWVVGYFVHTKEGIIIKRRNREE